MSQISQQGPVCARRRQAGVAAAALTLPPVASGIAAAPAPAAGGHAPAAGGYKVTRTVTVGASPAGVAADPAAGTVYVANQGEVAGDGTVSVIDEATNKVTHTIPVGFSYSNPEGVAADPAAGTVYVTNADSRIYFPGTVSVINVATNKVTHTIPVGIGPVGVAVDPAADTVYEAENDCGPPRRPADDARDCRQTGRPLPWLAR